jgi:hypothetical protein
MTPAKLRLAMASMGHPEIKIATLCAELGVTRQTHRTHRHGAAVAAPRSRIRLRKV